MSGIRAKIADTKKRKSLTLGRKLMIIHAVETNPGKKKSVIASEQGVPVKTLYSILKSKAEYTDQATRGQPTRRRQRGPQMQSVDDALVQWFSKSRTENKPISGPVLRAKAEELAATLGQEKWICTGSWLQRWRRRHGIALKCKRADVNEETPDCCVEDVPVPTLNISPSECYTVGDSVVTNGRSACPAFVASPSNSTVSDPKAGDTATADEDGDSDTELEKETRPISAREVLTATDTIDTFCMQAGSEQLLKRFRNFRACLLSHIREAGYNESRIGVPRYCYHSVPNVPGSMEYQSVEVKVEPQSESEVEEEMSHNSVFDRAEDDQHVKTEREDSSMEEEDMSHNSVFDRAEDNQHVKTERADSDVEEQDMSHNSMTADPPGNDYWMKRDFKIEVNEDYDEDTPHWNNLEHHAQDIDQISEGIHPERPAATGSHSDINPQCNAVSTGSMSTADLKTNMPRHTGGKPYKCTECEASFTQSGCLRRHMRRHTGLKPCTCTECKASFTRSDSLNKHMRIHTGLKPYKCTECEASFTWSSSLKQHMQIHTGIKPYKCKECEALFTKSSSLKVHMQIHTGVKPFSCRECEVTFSQSSSLNRHMRRHTGVKPYKCTECEALFTQSDGLKRHMRIHAGVKPYKCTECEISFTWSGSLNSHMQRHTGVKTCKCTECEASFTNSGSLKAHMQIHTGVKPFSCTECGATFSQSSNLNRHMRRHTGVKPYKCTECEAVFTQSDGLKRHVRIHAGVKPYKCTECEVSFTQSATLKKHIMRKHR